MKRIYFALIALIITTLSMAAKPIEPANDNVLRPGMQPEQLTVIDFNATWCGPCRLIGPGFDKASEMYGDKVTFYSVDIDRFPETANAFNISAVPTFYVIKPDGTMKAYVGLGDFMDGITDDTSMEEGMVILSNNLCNTIGALVK